MASGSDDEGSAASGSGSDDEGSVKGSESDAGSVVSSSASTMSTTSLIANGNMFTILQQMLQTKSGVNVADVLTRIADELSSIRVSLEAARPKEAEPAPVPAPTPAPIPADAADAQGAEATEVPGAAAA